MPVLHDARDAARHPDDGVRAFPPLSDLRLHLDGQRHPTGVYHDRLGLPRSRGKTNSPAQSSATLSIGRSSQRAHTTAMSSRTGEPRVTTLASAADRG